MRMALAGKSCFLGFISIDVCYLKKLFLLQHSMPIQKNAQIIDVVQFDGFY